MSLFAHTVCFFFALSFSLLAAAVLMLSLDRLWHPDSYALLVTVAALAALLLPAGAGLASRRLIRPGQPLTAWLVFYAVAALLAGLAGATL